MYQQQLMLNASDWLMALAHGMNFVITPDEYLQHTGYQGMDGFCGSSPIYSV